MPQYNTIAESNNFIVLEKYDKHSTVNDAPAAYQTEAALEREFIQDLINQGYEHASHIKTMEAMLANVRKQLQALNNMVFTDGEWSRFQEEYLNRPSDGLIAKTDKIQKNHIYDFVFDDGHIQNIYLVDKKTLYGTKFRWFLSSNRKVPTPTGMMLRYWSTVYRWFRWS